MNNIFDLLKLITNPKEYALNILQAQVNPMTNNLLQMAERNDKEALEKFARNMFKEKGLDYDKEIEPFRKYLK